MSLTLDLLCFCLTILPPGGRGGGRQDHTCLFLPMNQKAATLVAAALCVSLHRLIIPKSYVCGFVHFRRCLICRLGISQYSAQNQGRVESMIPQKGVSI